MPYETPPSEQQLVNEKEFDGDTWELVALFVVATQARLAAHESLLKAKGVTDEELEQAVKEARKELPRDLQGNLLLAELLKETVGSLTASLPEN
jgi:hypothetical protein